jgi:spore germination protein GerM
MEGDLTGLCGALNVRNYRIIAVLMVVIGVLLTCGIVGCGHKTSPHTCTDCDTSDLPPADAPKQAETPDKTPIKDALVTMLSKDVDGDRVFPAGVHINSVTLQDGVATVDFSHEFSQLANSGESVESAAQHALRSTLAQFTSVEKLRVTVEGKRFDSQATDWQTPFPVRETKREKSDSGQPVAAANNSTQ